MIYNTRVCYSNAFANHPPTPGALNNMWMAPRMLFDLIVAYVCLLWSGQYDYWSFSFFQEWHVQGIAVTGEFVIYSLENVTVFQEQLGRIVQVSL